MPWLAQSGSWDIALLILNLDPRCGQRHTPPLYPWEWIHYPLHRRMGGPYGPSGRVWRKENISPPSRIGAPARPYRGDLPYFLRLNRPPLYQNVRIFKRYFVSRSLKILTQAYICFKYAYLWPEVSLFYVTLFNFWLHRHLYLLQFWW